MSSSSEVLSQPFNLGFTYTRSTGPVVGRFLTALRSGKILSALKVLTVGYLCQPLNMTL